LPAASGAWLIRPNLARLGWLAKGVIDRLSATDAAFVALDRGPVPPQFAAILTFSSGMAVDVELALAERVAQVRRLRQRLIAPPPGCGRPIWVDDPQFDPRQHMVVRPAPESVPDLAAAIVLDRLPRDRPLWRAVVLSGPNDEAVALIMVVHHAVADGIGGLAVLADLVDGAAAQAPATAEPPPTTAALFGDAMRDRVVALGRAGSSVRAFLGSMANAGGVLVTTPASKSSLNRPTSARRRLLVVQAEIEPLRVLAHRYGTTMHSAMLVAVTDAVREFLRGRGEDVATLCVAVPIGGARAAGAVGNVVAPAIVRVPTEGDVGQRLNAVAEAVRAARAMAALPPPIAALGPAFRVAAALGGYRWYMNHQRRAHTLVSTVRGPQRPVAIGGAVVAGIAPVAVVDTGNVVVTFQTITYAGMLTVTINADPDGMPEMDALAEAVERHLARA
jgi:WS/DGAT/MGAT family acyltransferase